MIRIRILPTVLTTALLAAHCFSGAAQSVRGSQATPLKLKRADSSADELSYSPGKTHPLIEVGAADRLSAEDRDLGAKAQATIAEKAAFWGLDVKAGTWSQEQVVCPAMPRHLFLRFTRNGGVGDVSMFTAAIARSGGGVRLIPLVRRGYSLYTPAPVNAFTVSTFNRIRSEEKPGKDADWLAVGLCYAALAGSNPQVDFPNPATDQPKSSFPAWTSVVTVPVEGGAVVEFTDIAAKPQPMQWTLTFDAKGRLLKVENQAETALKVKEIHSEPTEPQGPVVRSKVDDAPGVPVKRTPDSGVPDGAVKRTPNNDSLPAPKQ